ncbi:HK97 family phage prohead protease [Paraburkholderia kirstenboschensis]|uniref:HK97 family phage prohead protease n=1 Tax=Paraburkholderia kirstenboschensis TaxID=1245436 RepID=A0ABZ0EIK1_9BURK|nr:HK97 family phage prohead protease [Paraburkholderia kirstenboschensis]WOD15953.1 HK97 family phage prohead protease [Paraburkholderia kirstenboschensis]
MARILRGYMTTDAVDCVGDIVRPEGATLNAMPLPLLAGHDHKLPIGKVVKVERSGNGLMATAHVIPQGESRIADDWWAALRHGAAVGLSIGFRPTKATPNSHGGKTFDGSKLHEVSLVPVPANSECVARIVEDTDSQPATPPANVKPQPSAVNTAKPATKTNDPVIERAKRDLIAQGLGFSNHADRVRKLATVGIKFQNPIN